MKVRVFDKNQNGKIEFTRKELEALLNEVYDEGYRDADSKHWTVTYGSETTLPNTITTTPYTPYTTPNIVYCSSESSTAVYDSSEASNAVGDSIIYGVETDGELTGQISFFD